MKKSINGFAHLILIIGVVLVGIVGIGYFAIKGGQIKLSTPKNITQSTTPTPTLDTSNQVPDSDLAGWKTYELIKDNVSIKLPRYLNDFTCDMNACWLASTRFDSGTTISLASSPSTLTSTTWNEVISELQENKINYTTKTLSGKEAILLKTNKGSLPFPTGLDSESLTKEGVVIKTGEGKWVSLFIYKFDKSLQGELPSEDELKTFNQILSTFEFLDDGRQVNYQEICEGHNGTWLERYDECESVESNKGIDKETCFEMGGIFNECASNIGCRHDDSGELCLPTAACIMLCKF